MAGLDPAIHDGPAKVIVDGRDKRGHDGSEFASPVGVGVIDAEGVEFAGRAITFEGGRQHVGHASAVEQRSQHRQVFRPHRLLDAIRSEALDGAAHEQPGLVD